MGAFAIVPSGDAGGETVGGLRRAIFERRKELADLEVEVAELLLERRPDLPVGPVPIEPQRNMEARAGGNRFAVSRAGGAS